MTDCPCGSQKRFANCCEPPLTQSQPAASPLDLMRSRYCAHVRSEARYLLQTTLPEQRHELDPSELQAWLDSTRWKALRILDDGQSSQNEHQGWVEFEALYEVQGKHFLHRERSHFEQRDGLWYFDLHPESDLWAGSHESQPLGRNDACPCGSGRKLKKCCALR